MNNINRNELPVVVLGAKSRICPPTILDKKKPYVNMAIYTKLEKKNDTLSDLVVFYLTSKENSPGFFDWTWKDGKPLKFAISKNSFLENNMQPQSTKYLEKMGNFKIIILGN